MPYPSKLEKRVQISYPAHRGQMPPQLNLSQDAETQTNPSGFIPPYPMALEPLTARQPKGKPDILGDMLTAGNMGTRMLDAYSTRKMLQNPDNHEAILPKAIAGSTPAMYGYSAGIGLLDMLAQKELMKHGHPKLAHALTAIDIGSDLPAGIHNLMLPSKPAQQIQTIKPKIPGLK